MSLLSFSLQVTVDVPQLEQTNELLAEILHQLKRFHRPPDAERPFPIFTEIADMPGQIKFDVQLPPAPENGDVASGELKVKIGDAEPLVRTVAPSDQFVVDEAFVGPQGAPVHLELTYIDDAGQPLGACGRVRRRAARHRAPGRSGRAGPADYGRDLSPEARRKTKQREERSHENDLTFAGGLHALFGWVQSTWHGESGRCRGLHGRRGRRSRSCFARGGLGAVDVVECHERQVAACRAEESGPGDVRLRRGMYVRCRTCGAAEVSRPGGGLLSSPRLPG